MITSCEDCVFAILEDQKQVGCNLGRLEKLEANGATLEFCNGYEVSYYKVHDRHCNACRNSRWGSENPRKRWRSIVEEQIALQYDALVYVDSDCVLNDIKLTVQSLSAQHLPPKNLVVIVPKDYKGSTVGEIASILFETCNVSWMIEEIKNDTIDPIDQSLTNVNSVYYGVFHAGYAVSPDYFARINKAINVDMKQILSVKPDKADNGMVIQRMIHDKVNGNTYGSALTKIIELTESSHQDFLVKDFSSL